MQLTGLHLLLTYRCTFECDHCFVWGSPKQTGVMTIDVIRRIVEQGATMPTVKTICFEGGEPFLYYGTLLAGLRLAHSAGFSTGVVTNGYWAISEEDAAAWLQPLQGLLGSLTISSDLFHYAEKISRQSAHGQAAAARLALGTSMITVAQPGSEQTGESSVMYRGRAAAMLAQGAARRPWQTLDRCLHEKLDSPKRVHVDYLGNMHVCQGIVIGNLLQQPLAELGAAYQPESHPIVGPLLAGGPAELARRYETPLADGYADACHLCYETRLALRERFPAELAPGQMYGLMAH